MRIRCLRIQGCGIGNPYSMRIDCLVDIQKPVDLSSLQHAWIASWTFKNVELCPYSMRIGCLVDIQGCGIVSLQHAH
jgi:hypothetical protein